MLSKKGEQRADEWCEHLEGARDHELRIMRESFVNNECIQARKSFVYKKSPSSTPLHLTLDQRRTHILDADCEVDPSAQPFSKALQMDGSKVAKIRLEALRKDVDVLKSGMPKLDVIIVSGNADSERCANQKAKAANKRVGIEAEAHRFEENNFSTKELEEHLIA